jgi:hypothetical protein
MQLVHRFSTIGSFRVLGIGRKTPSLDPLCTRLRCLLPPAVGVGAFFFALANRAGGHSYSGGPAGRTCFGPLSKLTAGNRQTIAVPFFPSPSRAIPCRTFDEQLDRLSMATAEARFRLAPLPEIFVAGLLRGSLRVRYVCIYFRSAGVPLPISAERTQPKIP